LISGYNFRKSLARKSGELGKGRILKRIDRLLPWQIKHDFFSFFLELKS
jgi:hypothetical protein